MDVDKIKLIQKMQRDNNKMFMGGLFLVIFAGWVVLLVWLLMCDVEVTKFEALGLGTISGVLLAILKDIYQFFFRKSGDPPEATK